MLLFIAALNAIYIYLGMIGYPTTPDVGHGKVYSQSRVESRKKAVGGPALKWEYYPGRF
jgi:hypothetical protein